MPARANTFDDLLAPVDPGTPKWATVVTIAGPDGAPRFTWHHYRDSETSIDFWPASVVKVYTAVAGLELLNELNMPTDSVLTFFHHAGNRWHLDAARTFPEMCSGIFRESSNEDYTLQLRFLGLDRLNAQFFTADNGFAHTALMRGYIHEPPYRYDPAQPQRITVTDPATGKTATVEHTWTGTPYAQNLGAHILDATTGNCSPTRDMAECLRRVMFHEALPEAERFNLTDEQLTLLREGRDGFTGLRNTNYAFAWDDAIAAVFPDARFYHKPGNISNFYLDLCYAADDATGRRFIAATATGSQDKSTCAAMNRAIAQWVRDAPA